MAAPIAALGSSALLGSAARVSEQQRQKQIKKAAAMLESMLVRQLFKVMRKTVPDGGLLPGGLGKSIFTEMLDGALADRAAQSGGFGLGRALAEQLGAKDAPPAATHLAALSASGGLPKMISPAVLQKLASTRAITQANAAAAPAPRRPTLAGATFEAPARAQHAPRDGDAALHSPLPDGRPVGADTFAGAAGNVVIAPASGKVLAADGSTLVIDHGNGLRTRLQGLGRVDAQPGDLILRDQLVGTLGAAGQLRLTVSRGGRALAPREVAPLLSR